MKQEPSVGTFAHRKGNSAMDILQYQQLLANQRAMAMQAQAQSMAATGYAQYSGFGGGGGEEMMGPSAPTPNSVGTAAATAIGGAAVGGLGLLGWGSMAYGMKRMGSLHRSAISLADPFTSGVAGFTRGMRGVMQGAGVSPQMGFGNMLKAFPQFAKTAGIGGVARGLAAGAMGAAAWAAPAIAATAGLKWATRQVSIGAGQQSAVSDTLADLRPFIGTKDSFGSAGVSAVRNVMMDYAGGGAGAPGRFSEARQLLYATAAGGEYKNTSTVKEFTQKFKKQLEEIKTLSSVLQTSAADAYATMKQTTGMGMYDRASQANYMMGTSFRSQGTGITQSSLMQVGLAGSQIASQFGVSRAAGAMGATRLTTSLARAAQTGLISGQKIQELTGMSVEEGAPTLALRMMQAVPTALQGELGQTVLAGIMDKTGGINRVKLAQFKAGAMTWEELRKSARMNLRNKGFLSTFSAQQTELTGQFMQSMGSSEMLQRLGGVYAQKAKTDPMSGMQALTGMSRDELSMLRKVETSSSELERTSMQEGKVRQMMGMKDQLRSSMLDPSKIMSRVKGQIFGPLEKKLQNFGAKISGDVSDYVNNYLDNLIDVQTSYVSKAFDDSMNQAMRGKGPTAHYRGMQALKKQFPATALAATTYLGGIPGGGSGGNLVGQIMSNAMYGGSPMSTGEVGIYDKASAEWGGADYSGGTYGKGESLGSEMALLASPEGFAMMGGLNPLKGLGARAWEGVYDEAGGGAYGIGAAAYMSPLTGKAVRGVMGAGWEGVKRLGGVAGNYLGAGAKAQKSFRLGQQMMTSTGISSALHLRSPGTSAAIAASRRSAWEPMWKGVGKYNKLGVIDTAKQVGSDVWSWGAATRAGKKAGAAVKVGRGVVGLGSAIDAVDMTADIAKTTTKAAGTVGKIGGKIIPGIGWVIGGVTAGVDTYAEYQRNEAFAAADYRVTDDYLRGRGYNVQEANPDFSSFMRDIAGAGGGESGLRMSRSGASDYAKIAAYSMFLSPLEMFGGEKFKKGAYDFFKITTAGELEGDMNLSGRGYDLKLFGGTEEQRKEIESSMTDIMWEVTKRVYPGSAKGGLFGSEEEGYGRGSEFKIPEGADVSKYVKEEVQKKFGKNGVKVFTKADPAFTTKTKDGGYKISTEEEVAGFDKYKDVLVKMNKDKFSKVAASVKSNPLLTEKFYGVLSKKDWIEEDHNLAGVAMQMSGFTSFESVNPTESEISKARGIAAKQIQGAWQSGGLAGAYGMGVAAFMGDDRVTAGLGKKDTEFMGWFSAKSQASAYEKTLMGDASGTDISQNLVKQVMQIGLAEAGVGGGQDIGSMVATGQTSALRELKKNMLTGLRAKGKSAGEFNRAISDLGVELVTARGAVGEGQDYDAGRLKNVYTEATTMLDSNSGAAVEAASAYAVGTSYLANARILQIAGKSEEAKQQLEKVGPAFGKSKLLAGALVGQFEEDAEAGIRLRENSKRITDQWKKGNIAGQIAYGLPSSSAAGKALTEYTSKIGAAWNTSNQDEITKLNNMVVEAIKTSGPADLERISRVITSDSHLSTSFGGITNNLLSLEKSWTRRAKPEKALKQAEQMFGLNVWQGMSDWEKKLTKGGEDVWTVQSRIAKSLRESYTFTGSEEEQNRAAYAIADDMRSAIHAKDLPSQKEYLAKVVGGLHDKAYRPTGLEGSGERAGGADFAQLVQLMDNGVMGTSLKKIAETFNNGFTVSITGLPTDGVATGTGVVEGAAEGEGT